MVYNPNGSLAVGHKAASSIFSATFSAIAVSAAQDVFELVTPATKRAILRRIILGQYSDVGDAAAEILSVLLITGYTTSGSVGAAVTPSPLHNNGLVSVCTVERNNTTLAQDGTPLILYADTFNIAPGWVYDPPHDERIILPASTRLVCRITAPIDALTMNGTLIFEEF